MGIKVEKSVSANAAPAQGPTLPILPSREKQNSVDAVPREVSLELLRVRESKGTTSQEYQDSIALAADLRALKQNLELEQTRATVSDSSARNLLDTEHQYERFSALALRAIKESNGSSSLREEIRASLPPFQQNEGGTSNTLTIRALDQLGIGDISLDVAVRNREILQTKVFALQEELRNASETLRSQISAMTKENKALRYWGIVDEGTVAKAEVGAGLSVKRIQLQQASVEKLQRSLAPLMHQSALLDSAIQIIAADRLNASGDPERANHTLAGLYTGPLAQELKKVAQTTPLGALLHTAVSNLESRGQLAPTIKQALDSRHDPLGARATVARLNEIAQPETDMRDQLYAAKTFTVLSSKPGVEVYGKDIPYYQGRAQKHFRDLVVKELELMGSSHAGERFRMHFDNHAEAIWNAIPQGAQPVFLREIHTPEFTRQRVSRGQGTLTLKNAPYEYVVQSGDIGYVKEGKVYRADSNPNAPTEVDVTTSPSRDWIARQICGARSFSLQPHASLVELRHFNAHGQQEKCPYGLFDLRTTTGELVTGVKVSTEASSLLSASPPEGMTLVLRRKPISTEFSTEYTEVCTRGRSSTSTRYRLVLGEPDMIRVEDLAYAKLESSGTRQLVVRDVKTEATSTIGESQLRTAEIGSTKQIQHILSNNPDLAYVQSMAVSSAHSLQELQGFIDAAKEGSPREAFVEFARGEAKQMLSHVESSETQQRLARASAVLNELKKLQTGAARSTDETALIQQIESLERFITVIQSDSTKNMLRTITDVSKFHADTWSSWSSNDLPVLAGTIAVATAAAVVVTSTTVLSGGAAAPLWVSLAVTAGATTAGGMLGAELTKEALYSINQNRSDGLRYSARSLLGEGLNGMQVFDESSGRFRERRWDEVGTVYGKQFVVGSALTFATMGTSKIFAGQISSALQQPGVLERVMERSPIAATMIRRMAAANTGALGEEEVKGLRQVLTRAGEKWFEEFKNEMGDELSEELVGKFFERAYQGTVGSSNLDGQLDWGTAAAVVIGTLKDIRPGKGSFHYNVNIINNSTDPIAARTDLVQSLIEKGYQVTDLGRGYYNLRTVQTGEVIQLVPDSAETGPEKVANTLPVGYSRSSADRAEIDAFVVRLGDVVAEDSVLSRGQLGRCDSFSVIRDQSGAIVSIVGSSTSGGTGGELAAIESVYTVAAERNRGFATLLVKQRVEELLVEGHVRIFYNAATTGGSKVFEALPELLRQAIVYYDTSRTYAGVYTDAYLNGFSSYEELEARLEEGAKYDAEVASRAKPARIQAMKDLISAFEHYPGAGDKINRLKARLRALERPEIADLDFEVSGSFDLSFSVDIMKRDEFREVPENISKEMDPNYEKSFSAEKIRGYSEIIAVRNGDGAIVALAAIAPAKEPSGTASIAALYVDPNHSGDNVGRGMLLAAFHRLRKQNHPRPVIEITSESTRQLLDSLPPSFLDRLEIRNSLRQEPSPHANSVVQLSPRHFPSAAEIATAPIDRLRAQVDAAERATVAFVEQHRAVASNMAFSGRGEQDLARILANHEAPPGAFYVWTIKELPADAREATAQLAEGARKAHVYATLTSPSRSATDRNPGGVLVIRHNGVGQVSNYSNGTYDIDGNQLRTAYSDHPNYIGETTIQLTPENFNQTVVGVLSHDSVQELSRLITQCERLQTELETASSNSESGLPTPDQLMKHSEAGVRAELARRTLALSLLNDAMSQALEHREAALAAGVEEVNGPRQTRR